MEIEYILSQKRNFIPWHRKFAWKEVAIIETKGSENWKTAINISKFFINILQIGYICYIKSRDFTFYNILNLGTVFTYMYKL